MGKQDQKKGNRYYYRNREAILATKTIKGGRPVFYIVRYDPPFVVFFE